MREREGGERCSRVHNEAKEEFSSWILHCSLRRSRFVLFASLEYRDIAESWRRTGGGRGVCQEIFKVGVTMMEEEEEA